MKKIIIYSLVVGLVALGCQKDDINPAPDLNDYVGAVTLVTQPTDPGDLFFNALNDLNGEQISFTLDYDNFGTTDVESLTIRLEYTETAGKFDIFRNEFVDTTYVTVDIDEIPVGNLPSTVTITGAEMLTILQGLNPKFTSVDSIEVGDFFQLTFPINLPDGTELTVALNSDLCNEPAQPSAGGCGFAWGVSCPSELDGVEASYVVNSWDTDAVSNIDATGTITWTQSGGSGVYEWSTFTFGTYQYLYGCCEQTAGGTALRVTDVCSSISMSPADGFGCGWSLTVNSVAGPVMNVTLAGDCQGTLDITMTRTDGLDWPIIP